MFDQKGGFSSADFDTADSELRNCLSVDEVAELIKHFPVFSSLHYHARLRQMRMRFEASPAEQPDGLFARFLSVYDCFFTLHHERVHYTAAQHGKASTAATVPYSPPLFAAVTALIGDREVEARGAVHVLPADLNALRAELSQLIGRQAVLPPYEHSPGAVFSLLVLRCLACGRLRLASHCHAADLRGNASWRQRFAQRQVNGDSCLNCRALRSEVVRPWISELPHPKDPLLLLSCLCVVDDYERIYLPPPGTQRHAEHDRIYEIRLEIMARQLGGRWARDNRAGVIHTDFIAYCTDEIEARLRMNDARGKASSEYEEMVQSLVEKLSSGTMPLHDAQRLLKMMIGPMVAEWPLVQVDGGEPYEVFVRRLILLTCVEARSQPALARLAAHCGVAHALLDLHETGLAEMSLNSARDLLPAVDQATRQDAEIACLFVQEGVHVARSEHAQANAVRAEIQGTIAAHAEHDTPSSRLQAAELRTNEGLALQRDLRLAEALQNIAGNVSDLAELESSLPQDDLITLTCARRARSGNLANLASVFMNVADGLELMDELEDCNGDYGSLSEHAIAVVQQMGNEQQLMDLQTELRERLPPVLALHLPLDCGVEGLHGHAAQLLEEAISLSQCVGHHEYLGIQWMQLAHIRSRQSQASMEDAALAEALRHSSLAANDSHVASICWEMASNAQARGQCAELLAALEHGLRAALRSQVKSGVAPGVLGRMGGLALLSAESDEERLRAIAISEGEKNLPLARSMSAGVALAGPQDSSPQARELAQVVARREQLRLQVMWHELKGSEALTQLNALDRQVEQLRQEAACRDPRYAAWHCATFLEPPGAPGLAALLAKLGPSATLVGFTMAGTHIYAYAAWDGGCLVAYVPYDGTPATLEDDPCSHAPWLLALWQTLAPRLDDSIDRHRLLISTCEEVAAVAWATLPVHGQPMAATTTSSIVHGLGMLSVCLDRPPPSVGPALVLGAPDRPDQMALPGTAAEAHAVASLLREAGVAVTGALTESDATAVRLVREAPACQLLHLACHAEPPSAGRAARLLLGPSVLQGDSGDLDDERIVADLAVQPGALVVMASCDSSKFGDAQRFINRGLVPAWLVVGASAVLGTLWPVADAAACEMIEAFYRHLLKGNPPSEALRLAQRDAAEGSLQDPVLREPRHWAGYQMHGLG